MNRSICAVIAATEYQMIVPILSILYHRVRISGLSLEYSNLHASCQGENGDMKHCGHAKGNDYDKALLISPLDKNCEKDLPIR